jgi:hypothetical protein
VILVLPGTYVPGFHIPPLRGWRIGSWLHGNANGYAAIANRYTVIANGHMAMATQ